MNQVTPKDYWKTRREKRAFVALEDGTVFHGYSVGAPVDALGEVVFNTGMTGYQEILSDPSYAGQFVVMTYPEIGNTGVNPEDMESRQFFANGFLVGELNEPSNWRSQESLSNALRRNNIPCLAGIDTRALTSKLRDEGTMRAYMVAGRETDKEGANAQDPTSNSEHPTAEREAIERARQWEGLDNQDYASRVSCKEQYQWDPDGTLTSSWGAFPAGRDADVGLPKADLRIVAYDFGIKWNILRSLRRNGMDVQVVPAKTPAADVLAMKPDGVFMSNGPADPLGVTYAIESAKHLVGKVPVMGICLGHQILGLATGGERFRLKFGHHGCNHPVKNIETGAVEITSQNHNYAVASSDAVAVTHMNLNDETVEGIKHKSEPMFAVQYHPEAGPGPHDPFYLFARFRELIATS